MKKISIFISLICLMLAGNASGQSIATDSAQVAKAFKELLAICKRVQAADAGTQAKEGFSKAAAYIAYRGSDAKRKWKDCSNYALPEEKERVDDMCFGINGSVNRDPDYVIAGYLQKKESEGTWHTLIVNYTKSGKAKQIHFAFLRIKDRFVLGDIN